MKTFTDPIQIQQPQPHKYIVIIDLEHVKGEIIEFPSLILDSLTGCEVGRFHWWVRPRAWDENTSKGKQNPDSNAVSFPEALLEFETKLRSLGIFNESFICLACGNWDIGTQIPKDCATNNLKLPSYFQQWINWKDLAKHFYKVPRQQAHLEDMLEYLELPLMNTSKKNISTSLQRTRIKRFHDVLSITRIVRKMLTDGAIMDWTGSRNDGKITYRFQKQTRVKRQNAFKQETHGLNFRSNRKNISKKIPQVFI